MLLFGKVRVIFVYWECYKSKVNRVVIEVLLKCYNRCLLNRYRKLYDVLNFIMIGGLKDLNVCYFGGL